MEGNGSSLKCSSPGLLYITDSKQYEKCIRKYNQPSKRASSIGTVSHNAYASCNCLNMNIEIKGVTLVECTVRLLTFHLILTATTIPNPVMVQFFVVVGAGKNNS